MNVMEIEMMIGEEEYIIDVIPWNEGLLKVFVGGKGVSETYKYDPKTMKLERDTMRSRIKMAETKTPSMALVEKMVMEELLKLSVETMP